MPVSEDAVALAPDGDSGLRTRVLANHARVLAGMGHYAEAETVGMEALQPRRAGLDLSGLASEVITTLSGLKRTGPKEGCGRRSRTPSPAPSRPGHCRRSCGLATCSAGPTRTGRSSTRPSGGSAARHRARRRGRHPVRPFAFESRWQAGVGLRRAGRWDEAMALTDVAADNPPPIPRALLAPLRFAIRLARGGTSPPRPARGMFWGLRRWRRHQRERGGDRRGRSPGDAAAAVEAYDEVVSVLSRIWHEWFSARIRLGSDHRRRRPAVPSMSAAERASYAERVDRINADGHVVLDRYPDPSGHWGPEGRAG